MTKQEEELLPRTWERTSPPAAIVVNMFYTGLGIARSLGEQGIRVIGLSAHREAYGNFTRYAEVRSCPDSREQPEALLEYLLQLGEELPEGGVIFPTRDHDLRFLSRFREQLRQSYALVMPDRNALETSLNKWETYRAAQSAGVPVPKCWSITGKEDLLRVERELRFPSVLKPVSAHHWREGANWKLVGSRKAIAVRSFEELLGEYEKIATVESRALLQEMVPGGDDALFIAACYLDRQSTLIAGFTAQKLVQVPAGFGTGCIVQTVDRPELLQSAAKLLRTIGFSGIAEVEFKWDEDARNYKLIEINPRPWDQHRLGQACGVDLIPIAYRDSAGLAVAPVAKQKTGQKWIAEDVYWLLLIRTLWKREGNLRSLRRLSRGPRVYAIWSVKDPLPLLGYLVTQFVPGLAITFFRHVRSLLRRPVADHGYV